MWTWINYLPYIFAAAGMPLLAASLWYWWRLRRDMKREDERQRRAAAMRELQLLEAERRDSWAPYFKERWER